MQTLRLADDLFADVLSGRKGCTIRLGQSPIGFGPVMLIGVDDPRVSVTVNVHRIEYVLAENISPAAIRADGASSLKDLFGKLARFYPSISAQDTVTVIWIEPRFHNRNRLPPIPMALAS